MSAHDEVTGGPGLLHNMSARPTTEVTYSVAPLRRDWVAFRWSVAPTLDAQYVERLEHFWHSCGFRGAALVHPLTDELCEAVGEVHTCEVPLLASNVLLRYRGSLLLADMPLLDATDGLVHRGVATDDPRLVALSGGVQ